MSNTAVVYWSILWLISSQLRVLTAVRSSSDYAFFFYKGVNVIDLSVHMGTKISICA